MEKKKQQTETLSWGTPAGMQPDCTPEIILGKDFLF
jgi:hypothetical protein